jgi:hypothetical protein
VDDAGGREEEVAGTETVALSVAEEPTFAAHDDVRLVSVVRSLFIASARRVQLDFEGAVLEKPHESLAVRGRKTPEGGFERDVRGWFHGPLLCGRIVVGACSKLAATLSWLLLGAETTK